MALSLIVSGADAVELNTVHRFKNRTEAAPHCSSEQDTTGLNFHDAHGRFRGGEHEDMIEAVHTAWTTDMNDGLNTLMLAPQPPM